MDGQSIRLLAYQTQGNLKQLLHHMGVFISTLAAFTSTDTEYLPHPIYNQQFLHNPYVLQDPNRQHGNHPPSATIIARQKKNAELLMDDIARCQEDYLVTIEVVSRNLETLDGLVSSISPALVKALEGIASGSLPSSSSSSSSSLLPPITTTTTTTNATPIVTTVTPATTSATTDEVINTSGQTTTTTMHNPDTNIDIGPSQSLISHPTTAPTTTTTATPATTANQATDLPPLSSIRMETVHSYPQPVIQSYLHILGIQPQSSFPSTQEYVEYLKQTREDLRKKIVQQNRHIQSIIDQCQSIRTALALYRP